MNILECNFLIGKFLSLSLNEKEPGRLGSHFAELRFLFRYCNEKVTCGPGLCFLVTFLIIQGKVAGLITHRGNTIWI